MTDESTRRGLRGLVDDGPVEDAADAARRVGLSLERLEVLRRHPGLAEAVLEAVRAGADPEDLEALDWEAAAEEAFGEGADLCGSPSRDGASAASA